MTLRRFLKRLRLKQGDILLVERYHGMPSLDDIMRIRLNNIDFSVPILFHNGKHSIERMPFEELERIYLEAKKTHG